MRKILASIMAVALCLSFVSCSTDAGEASYISELSGYVTPKYSVYKKKSNEELKGTKIALHGRIIDGKLGTPNGNQWCYLTLQTEDGDWQISINALTTQDIIDSYAEREFYVYGLYSGLSWGTYPSIKFEEYEHGLYEAGTDSHFTAYDFEKPAEVIYENIIWFDSDNSVAFNISKNSDGALSGSALVSFDGFNIRRETALLETLLLAFDLTGFENYTIFLRSGEDTGTVMFIDGEMSNYVPALPTAHQIAIQDSLELLNEHSEDCLYLLDSLSDYPGIEDVRIGVTTLIDTAEG